MRRSRLLMGSFLIVPSVITAGFVLWLLSNESARLRASSLSATQDRAARIAELVALSVDEAKRGIMASLAGLPESELPTELNRWQKGSPLVVAVSSCSAVGVPLMTDAADGPLGLLRENGLYVWQRQLPLPLAPLRSPVTELKGKSAWGVNNVATKSVAQSDWVYRESDDHIRLVAWCRPSWTGNVRAVELSVDALLEDLQKAFPSSPAPTDVFQLVTDKGKALIASAPVDVARPAEISIPIENMPGWTLSAHHLWHRSAGSKLFTIGASVTGLLTALVGIGTVLLVRQSRQDARSALRKTHFVSNVSHELKTPLTSIRMYADLLKEGKVSDSDRRSKYLNVISEESRRLTRLVNNVLDLGQLERGAKKLDLAETDLGEIVDRALDAQRISYDRIGMRVEIDAPVNTPRVRADPDALEAVLVNLIDNAVKYAADGKVLRISMTSDSESACVALSDDGPGVSAHQTETVFERFHRLESGITDQAGTGLGLSISRQLVRAMGGDIRCVPCKGGRFEVTLPLCPTAHQPVSDIPPSAV